MANVNVNEVKLCPNKNCGVVLPNPEPEKCISCGSLLRSPENKYFGTPDYLTMQLDDLTSRAKEPYAKVMDKDRIDAELIKDEKKKMVEKLNDVNSHYLAWLKVMPKNDLFAAMRDAKAIMQNILLSNTDRSSLVTIVKLGKEIGELSKHIDEYLKAGGQNINFDHLLLPVEPSIIDENEPNM